MKNVAREMNLSETAFLHPESHGYRLRWFTPTVEVDLCGHATLASAHVLWERGHLDQMNPAHFFTRSGVLKADRVEDGIRLDFPAKPVLRTAELAPFVDALGDAPRAGFWNEYDVLLEYEDERTIRSLRPDFTKLKAVPARGIIVTAPASTSEFHFVSRFFAPASGIDEDPVTGSAHCCLAPFWRERLGLDEMVGFQASDRGGVVRVRCVNDRVHIIGKAVTVLVGELVGDASLD
jgi:predicted PhzF superfamily epimerase YddE/YHI9